MFAHLITLGLIILVGAGLRVWAGFGPMLYDEVHTFMAYVLRSFEVVISSYKVPNNHVLHTIFAWMSVRVWGESVFAFRLPALVFSILLIPAVFLLAARVFCGAVALWAAALVALSPSMIRYGSEGRGYGLQMLLAVLSALAVQYEAEQKQKSFWWMTGLCSALAFLALPTQVYAIGGIYAWGFYLYRQKVQVMRARDWILWSANIPYVIGLTMFFYGAVLSRYGLSAFQRQLKTAPGFWDFVAWLINDYLGIMLRYFHSNQESFVYLCCTWLFACFAVVGWKRFKSGWVLIGALFLWSVVALLILQSTPYTRNYLVMFPFYSLAVGAGAVCLYEVFGQKKYLRWLGGFLCAVLVWQASLDTYHFIEERVDPSGYNSRAVFDLIKDEIRTGDHFALPINMLGRIRYYFYVNGIEYERFSRNKDRVEIKILRNPLAGGGEAHAHRIYAYRVGFKAPEPGASYKQIDTLARQHDSVAVFQRANAVK